MGDCCPNASNSCLNCKVVNSITLPFTVELQDMDALAWGGMVVERLPGIVICFDLLK